MSVKDMSYRERGILISLVAHQCYCTPDKLLEARPGIKSLDPIKKFFFLFDFVLYIFLPTK